MKMILATLLITAIVLAVGTASGQAVNPSKGSAAAPSTCCMDSKAQMSQMDEHMQRMQALHDKMANATPEERQKLMAEQRQEMQQSMGMMQQMQHGGAMMGGGMMSQKGKPADQRSQMQMLEKRMDMMQMMMQSMMDQQGAAPAGPAK